MTKVFISYRRDDSAYAVHAIYKKLVGHYGEKSVVSSPEPSANRSR